MKRINAKIYLWGSAAVVLLIAGFTYCYLFSGLSKSAKTEYVYIDSDDTQDSVFSKIHPIANAIPMSGFSTLARHSGYADHIRTGRYAIHPGEGALMVFRHLKNG